MSEHVELRPFAGSDTEWNTFAARFGTVFHSADWLRLLEATQDAKMLRLGVHADDRLVGILPLFTKRVFLFRVAASPMVVEDTPYLGLACDPRHVRAALDAVRSYARKRGFQFVRLLQRELLADGATPTSFANIERHTHVVDLRQSVEAIWGNMERKCRNGIRKAQKSGVVIQREQDRSCIEPYFRILSARYDEQQMLTPNSQEFFLRLWDTFRDSGLAVLTARFEETMIAGAIILMDADVAYYLNGCSLTAFNHLNPNRLVQWEAIQLAKSMGALRYDFVGSDIPRLAMFKRSFGGTLTRYSLLESASSPWVEVARRRYPEMKQAMNRLRAKMRVRRAAESTTHNSEVDA